MKINVVQSVLKANDLVARENREAFRKSGALALNLISSPGSGKTTLLEKTISALNPDQTSVVIVGDLETTRDAERLSGSARDVVQINTGMSCHLYANQIAKSLEDLNLEAADYIFIENVGNMVCPGEFDLGENLKVALLSVPEGDDKVAKYPTIFRAADAVLLTKSDLLHVLDFDLARVRDDLSKLNSGVPFFMLSSLRGEGMEAWLEWLKERRRSCVGAEAKFIP